MSLVAEDLYFKTQGRELLHGVSLTVLPGSVHALVGPNGAGKSTLLKILARDLVPQAGSVRLNDRPLATWPPQALARQRAVLPQTDTLSFDFTAVEVVALGRLPCARHSAARERAIVDEALGAAHASELAGRIYTTLSGGERARVQLARVMAQLWEPNDAPRFLLLDEPTASLDLAHQHACLGMIRRFAASGCGVLVILHDPNLAMRYADQVSLLHRGRRLCTGTPDQVLTAEHLHAIYGLPVRVVSIADEQRPTIIAG